MKRHALQELKHWKEAERRKPLLVQGARQVGKTWLMREFGRQEFRSVAYINFMEIQTAHAVFDGDLSPDTLLLSLSVLTRTPIRAGETLIILDEIQECEKALTALKFFSEQAPQYHIIAAGSLLGVALRHKKMSFPVGQVDFLELHPLSFFEFLDAVGEGMLAELLRSAPPESTAPFRERLTELLRQYLFVGGMPEAVARFAETRDYAAAREVQRAILQGYENDFSKYTDNRNITRIREVWRSLPVQLAKERKFSYSGVKPGGRGRDYEEAIEWLQNCGLVHKLPRLTKPANPMPAYAESGVFKLYVSDCGLLGALSQLDAGVLLRGVGVFEEFKGALTEQYVLQTLLLNKALPLAYWTTPKNTAEVDFLFSYGGAIIPLEVKATLNLKAKSLAEYRVKYAPPYAVRTSLANYGVQDGLHSIPLYLMERLLSLLPDFADGAPHGRP